MSWPLRKILKTTNTKSMASCCKNVTDLEVNIDLFQIIIGDSTCKIENKDNILKHEKVLFPNDV